MSDTVQITDFHNACYHVVNAGAPGTLTGNMPYAQSYARNGLRMHNIDEQRAQALYILVNITHWRGEGAKEVRAFLKSFSKGQ